jgi:hypothetical protein
MMIISVSLNHHGVKAVTDKTTRVQLQLSEPAMQRLRRLQELTDSPTYVDVFKSSLRVLEFMCLEAMKGNEFQIKAPDGTVTVLKVFLDESVPSKDSI